MAENKNKASLQQTKWSAVFELMQVVINGKPPKSLFKERKPLESKDNHTLDYRLANYHPVQTSLFKRAIQQYIEVLSKSDVSIESQSTAFNKFKDNFRKYENGKRFKLQEWLLFYIAEKRQLDPNGLILLYPEIKFDEQNKPIAIPKSNTSIELKIDYVSYNKIKEINEQIVDVEIGKIKIEEKLEPYYLTVNNTQYDVRYPVLVKGNVEYRTIPFYIHNLKVIPTTHIGGSYMTETYENNDTFDYFVSDFFGAVAFAAYMITSLSDKQVMNARFNYPIRYQVKKKCKANGCHKEDGKYYVGDGEARKICSNCNGTGRDEDIDMFGTYELDPGSTLDGTNIDIKAPIGYVTPPIESLKYINEDFTDYYTKTANELCVNVKQNITNQSAESKSYDVQAKVSLITYIIEDVLRVTKDVYSFAEMLLENKPEANITVNKPDTWDIKSKEDILTQLVAAKSGNAPAWVVSELSKELLIKELQNFPHAQEIVEVMMNKNRLLSYGATDLKDARVLFGNDLNQRDITIQTQGLNILKNIVLEKKEVNTQQLETLFETELAKYIPTTVNTGL